MPLQVIAFSSDESRKFVSADAAAEWINSTLPPSAIKSARYTGDMITRSIAADLPITVEHKKWYFDEVFDGSN